LEILPFDDPIIVLELDGATLWDALEASLSTWPAQEGYVCCSSRYWFLMCNRALRRFPVISGFRVSWDSRREPGQRVLGVWLLRELAETVYGSESNTPTPKLVDDRPIERITEGRKYKIVTREYMAQGHDGFTALQNQKYLIDDENGQVMSAIVRRYLLGVCRHLSLQCRHFIRFQVRIS
jgi:5'-nucleotidase